MGQHFMKKKIPAWVAKKASYKPSRTKFWDLTHTKLEVSFDWQKQHLLGKAALFLEPYFYPQSTLVLDAKGLDVKSVVCYRGKILIPSTFQNDGLLGKDGI